MAKVGYWLWLSTLAGVSAQSKLRVVKHFGSPEAVFRADPARFSEVEGLRSAEIRALKFRDVHRAENVLEDCRKFGIKILTLEDERYPRRLLNIDVPPLVLYYKGTVLPFDDLPAVAVVGAREGSRYGRDQAKRLGYELARCGGVVVSGAARGVDSEALEGALQCGAPVAAVLGNGLDVVYPQENGKLYEAVAAHGCLMSEYVPGTAPLGRHFPIRNRIISGLCLGTLVVEGTMKSGSLITAELALEQGRDVYAVPGNLGEHCCEGSNRLIQDGASLVTCGWDIMQNYQARFPDRVRHYEKDPGKNTAQQSGSEQVETGKTDPASAASIPPESEKRIDNGQKRNYIDLQQIKQTLSEPQQKLMETLDGGRMHVDDLIAKSGLPAAQVSAAMTMLELKGLVTRQTGNFFVSNAI